jgi:radical SAM protein with 4Fe4S-binding SPASM domain
MYDLKEMDCRAIQFSGGGEPTVHPEFGAMLVMAKIHEFRTLVVTNGGMLDRWIGQLGDCADHVRISLDASNEEEHRKMHGSKEKEFEHVCENVRWLVKEKVGEKWPEVGLTYNVADCNSSVESFHRFFELAVALGVNFVQVRPLSEQTRALLTQPWPMLAEKARLLSNWLDRRGIRVEIHGYRDKDVFFQREFDRCYAALSLAVISANGDVSACCDRRDLTFGNVNEKPFREIWLSAEHRQLAKGIVPTLCQRCVLCGYNRSVEKFVVGNESVPELV